MSVSIQFFLISIIINAIDSYILKIDLQFINTTEWYNKHVQTPCTHLKITGNTAINYDGPCQNQFSYFLDIDLDDIQGIKFEFTIDATDRQGKTCYVYGSVYVDGYKFLVREDSTFYSPALYNSGAFPGWKYFKPNGNSGKLTFEIFDDKTLNGKSPDGFTEQFQCQGHNYYLYYNTTASPVDVELEIEKTNSTQLKEADDIVFDWNTANSNSLCLSTNDTPIQNMTKVPHVKPFKYYINTNNKDTYFESVNFTVYRNSSRKDCEPKTLKFLVCGENCKLCEGYSSYSAKCIECYTGYSFVEGDDKKCVHRETFIRDNKYHYYLDDNNGANTLRKCHDNCQSCEGPSSSIGSLELHNCINCSQFYPYFVENGNQHKNCYQSCTPNNLYQREDEMVCVEQCVPNYNFTYIATGGAKKCLGECNKQGRTEAQYRLYDTYQCADSCTGSYPFIMDNQNICLQNCSTSNGHPYRIDYNSNKCIDRCPNDKPLIINGEICTKSCPEGYPYEYKGTCIYNCEVNNSLYKVDESILRYKCTDECDSINYPYKMTTTEGKKICTKSCYGGIFYLDVEEMECLADCPNTKYMYKGNNTCVSECIGESWGYADTTNKECVSNCTINGKYLSGVGNECVDDCTTGQFIYKYAGRCVSQCPDDAPYIYNDGKNQCVQSCNADYPYLYEKTCLKECKDGNNALLYQLGNEYKCVSRCPVDYPYSFNLSSPNPGIKRCVKQCEAPLPYAFADTVNKYCSNNCDSKVALPPEYTCEDNCNTLYPYNLDGVCVKQCDTSKPYVSNDVCIADCKTNHQYLYDNKFCVNSCANTDKPLLVNSKFCDVDCPENYPYLNVSTNECLSFCPYPATRYFKLENKCLDNDNTIGYFKVDSNSKNYFTDNCAEFGQVRNPDNTCNTTCLDQDYPYILPPENICVDRCINPYPYLNGINKTCVPKCEDIYNYEVKDKHYCYYECPTTYPYEIENSKICTDDCPQLPDTPYTYIDGAIMKCVAHCNITTYEFISSNKTNCVPSCESISEVIKEGTNECMTNCEAPYSFYDESTNICMKECDRLIVEGTPDKCVNVCPPDKPLKYNNICVSQCNDRAKAYINVVDNTCVSECSTGYEYLYEDNGIYKCYAQCPSNYENGNSKICVDSCQSPYPYTQHCITSLTNCGSYKRCTSKCENPLPYLDELADNCVENCGMKFTFGTELLCVDSCRDPYPYLIVGQNKCTNECKSLGMYINELQNMCVFSCPPGYGIQQNDHLCVATCPPPTIIRDFNTGYCINGCSNNQFYDLTYHTCKTQCDADSYAIPEINQCTSSITGCITNYEYKLSDMNICVSECGYLGYDLTDSDNKECLKDCSSSNYHAFYKLNNKCVTDCPALTIKGDGVCIFDLEFGDVENGMLTSRYTKERLDEIINDNIQNIYHVNYTIKGKDFIMQVYSTDEKFNDMNTVSSIDFSQCEGVLRELGILSSKEKLIICKIDTWIDGDITNTVEYRAYNEKGTEISLLPCNEVTTIVSSPFTMNSSIKYEKGESLSLSGYDLFNPDDPFFNDICIQFDIEHKDVLLAQRRQLYYQNITFCDSGCNYINVDYQKEKINCECKANKDYIPSSPVHSNNIDNDYLSNKNNPSNINVVKCYSLLSSWSNLKRNISFWLGIPSIIATISLLIVNLKIGFNSIFDIVTRYTGAPSRSERDEDNFFEIQDIKENNNSNRKLSDDTDLMKEDLFKKGEQINDKLYRNYFDFQIKATEFEFPSNEIKELTMSQSSEEYQKPEKIKHIEYLALPLAVHYDKRDYCTMLKNILTQKIFLLRALIIQSPFELRALNISMYIMLLIFILTFNALFYSNGMILNRYNDNEGNDTWIRAVLSNLFSVILYRIAMYAISYSYILETIVFGVVKRETLVEMSKKVINKIKLNILLYYIVDIAIVTFCWYYLMTFNAVYKYCQSMWILGCINSILLLLIYNSFLALVISILRYFGLAIYSCNMYHCAIFLQKYL